MVLEVVGILAQHWGDAIMHDHAINWSKKEWYLLRSCKGSVVAHIEQVGDLLRLGLKM